MIAREPVSRTSMEHWQPYPEYKDSGIEWLGEIPSHWELRRLKHVSTIKLSTVDKKSYEEDIPVRLCNYVDVYYNELITDDLDFMNATATAVQFRDFELKSDDVIITKDSESWDDIAVPAYVSQDLEQVVCGYHLALIRPSGVFGKYLFRVFQSKSGAHPFKIQANGITRYGLPQRAIRDAVFPIPPIEEQHSIAAFLDRETARVDRLIAAKERLTALLQEKRVALISHVVTKGLDPNVSLKNSGIPSIGAIPAHWQVKRNKRIFREVDERSSTGQEELLTVSHITGVTRRSEKTVNMFMAESLEGYKICRVNDIAVNTMWAWMGALGVVWAEGVVSPSYNVYRLNNKQQFVPRYLDLLYRTSEYVTEINRFSKGVWSSRLRLYPDAFFEMYTIAPPVDEQVQILAFIDQQTHHTDLFLGKLKQSIELLSEYRSALITATVTGKIDVRDEGMT